MDLANITWRFQVIVTLDENKIIVFKKRIPQGFITSIPLKGQITSIFIVGAKEEWEKAQKIWVPIMLVKSMFPSREGGGKKRKKNTTSN